MRSERIHNPDRWEIVKVVTSKYTYFSILGDWSGSYLEGRRWRLSSGISSVKEEGDYYIFENVSGSKYKCAKPMKSLGVMSSGIFRQMQEEVQEEEGASAELVSVEQLQKELEELNDNSN